MVYRLQYYGLLTVSILVAMLPRPGMVRLGRFLGGLIFVIWKSGQRITLTNLDLAFGETKTNAEKKSIVKETFKNLGASMLEISWGLVRMNEKVFLKSAEIEGLELVKSALSKGRGVLFLPSHYGNWEMMLNSFGYLGLNMHYEDQDMYNLTQRCMRFIEAFIRKDPQYWIWGHKRWKSEV